MTPFHEHGIIEEFHVLPDEVGETSGQVHCGRTAAEHGEDALQVEQLQELVVTGGRTDNTRQ